MVKSLVIAGTQSSVGKTTLVVGLSATLRTRGLAVQPFKVGPDYIDPSHHTLAAGRPCRNLDTWMMPAERMKALFVQTTLDADLALIEGVMGLFDGQGYEEEIGSTAHIAKLLESRVLLVIDASKSARSTAAVALGFQQFDKKVALAGFLLNRVGSEQHGQGVAAAIERATALPVLGWMPRRESLAIPERHLGLIPTAEPGAWENFICSAQGMVEERINLDQVLALAAEVPLPPEAALPTSIMPPNGPSVVIAVARDEAFHFCYEENLALLKQQGATIRYFSPLQDEELPAHSSGILLSGGFPEIYAEQLSVNQGMHQSLRRAHQQNLPIYAECGGLMYLTQSIVDFTGRNFPMVGLLPGHSVMTRRLTLGYRQVQAAKTSWLFESQEFVRGHEFHYSAWEDRPEGLPAAYIVEPHLHPGDARPEGACLGNLWASYVHLHFWGKPELAARFVAACRSCSCN